MATLKHGTTIDGALVEKEGTGVTAAATVALPQKGSTVVFEATNSTSFASSAYDISTNKYVVAYRDDTDGGKGKAIVGTPSGDSVVWGTPVQFSTGETTALTGTNVAEMGFCMTYDPDTERMIIAWSEGDISGSSVPSGAGKGTSKVGTVSGTGSGGTITFGSEGTFSGGPGGILTVTLTHNPALPSPPGPATFNLVNASFTTLTGSGSGAKASVNGTALTADFDPANHPNNTRGSGYAVGDTLQSGHKPDNINSAWLATVATVDTPAAVAADSGQASQDGTRFCQCMTYDTTNNKMVLIWNKASATQPAGGQCAVGTIVGGGTNSITWGTAVDINPIGGVVTHLNWEFPAIVFDPSSGNIVVVWEGEETSLGSASFIRVGTVSGTSITFGTTIIHSDADVDDPAMSYDPVAEKIVFVYQDYGGRSHDTYGAGAQNAARVGTVSGTGSSATCHLGYPVDYSQEQGTSGYPRSNKHDIVYNTSVQRHLVHYTYYWGSNVGVYPYQQLMTKSAKVTAVTLSCTRTNASTTVTTADTSSLAFGMSVSGTGMGTGALYTEVTTIASITNSTTFVLSAAASAGGTSSLSFTSILFSGETIINGDGTANYGTGTDNSSRSHMQLKMAYNSADNKMLVPRPGDAGDAVGIIINFDGTGLTVDLATGSFFEIDLENATEEVAELIISNPHTSQVSTFKLQITQGFIPRVIRWDGQGNIKWPGGTAPTLTTTDRNVDILQFTTYDAGTTWYGKVVGQNYPENYAFATNTDILFGARGVWAGFSHGSGYETRIDYITIATTGDATIFGDLTAGHNRNVAGTSNGSRGVFPGQSFAVTTIDYITIATTGDATDFGDLTQGRGIISATSDGSRGVFAGGTTGSTGADIVDTIDYITIATTGDATDFGNLTVVAEGKGSASDGSRGLFAAGSTNGSHVLSIDYISIATPANAKDFGDMLETRRLLSGASDGSRGVFGGGGYMGGNNWGDGLEYVTISTRSNSILFGNLTHTTVNQVAATSNGPRGVWGGGYVTNIIAYITIATTGDALDFGDLTVAGGGSGATSGD
jgi:hypothetical protein